MLSITCKIWDKKEEYWVPTIKLLTEAILQGESALKAVSIPAIPTKTEWVQPPLPLEVKTLENLHDVHGKEIAHGDVIRIVTPAFMGRALEFTALVEKRRKGFCFSAVDMRFANAQHNTLFGGGYKEIVGSLPA